MKPLAFAVEVGGSLESVGEKVVEAIKPAGFGVLTRIEFDQKIREKTGHEINRCVILGACNPHLALEAYRQTTDTALLIPCNIVLTETKPGWVRVEAMKPSAMLNVLPQVQKSSAMETAEKNLELALESLTKSPS